MTRIELVSGLLGWCFLFSALSMLWFLYKALTGSATWTPFALLLLLTLLILTLAYRCYGLSRRLAAKYNLTSPPSEGPG